MHMKIKRLLLEVAVIALLSGCREAEQSMQTPATFESPLASRHRVESPLSSPDALESPVASFKGKLAFHSQRSGILQIYVLDGDTGEITRLTNDSAGAFEPNWSPDCSSIVYTSKRDDPNSFAIYTMGDDGSDQMRLFEHQPEDDWAPAWSPNGTMIAYQTNPNGRFTICFVSTEGEREGCLEESVDAGSPSWSPDGETLLFTANWDGYWQIYAINRSDGTGPTQLTHNGYTEKYPKFSPDGRYIAFSSKREEGFDIFIMRADGSDEIQLTTHSADDVSPEWIGNDQIVFASLRSLFGSSRDWDLYLMDRDGQNITRLTDTKGLDKWPSWCLPAE